MVFFYVEVNWHNIFCQKRYPVPNFIQIITQLSNKQVITNEFLVNRYKEW